MEAVLDAWSKVEEAEVKRIEARRRVQERAQAAAQESDGT